MYGSTFGVSASSTAAPALNSEKSAMSTGSGTAFQRANSNAAQPSIAATSSGTVSQGVNAASFSRYVSMGKGGPAAPQTLNRSQIMMGPQAMVGPRPPMMMAPPQQDIMMKGGVPMMRPHPYHPQPLPPMDPWAKGPGPYKGAPPGKGMKPY